MDEWILSTVGSHTQCVASLPVSEMKCCTLLRASDPTPASLHALRGLYSDVKVQGAPHKMRWWRTFYVMTAQISAHAHRLPGRRRIHAASSLVNAALPSSRWTSIIALLASTPPTKLHRKPILLERTYESTTPEHGAIRAGRPCARPRCVSVPAKSVERRPRSSLQTNDSYQLD